MNRRIHVSSADDECTRGHDDMTSGTAAPSFLNSCWSQPAAPATSWVKRPQKLPVAFSCETAIINARTRARQARHTRVCLI